MLPSRALILPELGEQNSANSYTTLSWLFQTWSLYPHTTVISWKPPEQPSGPGTSSQDQGQQPVTPVRLWQDASNVPRSPQGSEEYRPGTQSSSGQSWPRSLSTCLQNSPGGQRSGHPKSHSHCDSISVSFLLLLPVTDGTSTGQSRTSQQKPPWPGSRERILVSA